MMRRAYIVNPIRTPVGVPTTLGAVLLPRLAALCQEKYPGIKLHMADGFSATIHQWLLSGKLDIALVYVDKKIGPMSLTPLFTEKMVFITHDRALSTRKISPKIMGQQKFVLPSRPNRLRLLYDDYCLTHGLENDPVLEVDSLPALIELVRGGVGNSILPYSAIYEYARREEIFFAEIAPASLTRDIAIARPDGLPPTAATHILEAELQNLISHMATEMRWVPYQDSSK